MGPHRPGLGLGRGLTRRELIRPLLLRVMAEPHPAALQALVDARVVQQQVVPRAAERPLQTESMRNLGCKTSGEVCDTARKRWEQRAALPPQVAQPEALLSRFICLASLLVRAIPLALEVLHHLYRHRPVRAAVRQRCRSDAEVATRPWPVACELLLAAAPVCCEASQQTPGPTRTHRDVAAHQIPVVARHHRATPWESVSAPKRQPLWKLQVQLLGQRQAAPRLAAPRMV
mmetsp:Transcript_155463/g.269484  ORF Transcript_155463/g.269484 Transcript_155463/m.269484 type:complete len:231 (+) Transcript_155463:274-966(+)